MGSDDGIRGSKGEAALIAKRAPMSLGDFAIAHGVMPHRVTGRELFGGMRQGQETALHAELE